MSRTLALVGVLLAGCPGGGDDTNVDGGGDTTGLRITWASAPPVPGPVATDRTVQDLAITYSSVQLQGDAAPGDERTTLQLPPPLEWDERGGPAPLEFPEAPPGIYSGVGLGIGGATERLRIDGEVNLGGTWIPFEIEDEAAPSTTVPLALHVPAGELTTLPLEVDVEEVLAAVPFDQLPLEEDHLELRTEDPAMQGVRDALVRAIRVAATTER